MANKSRLTTDAAQELAKLVRILVSHQPGNHGAAYAVFGLLINGDEINDPVIASYNAINKRTDRLICMINELDDDYIEEETQKIGLDAIRSIQSMFTCQSMGTNWHSLLASKLSKEHIVALTFLSPIVGRHHPLASIRGEEINEIIQKLGAAIDEINSSTNLPDWSRTLLVTAVRDLNFILKNFIIFGHDEAISGLTNLVGAAASVIKSTEGSTSKPIRLPVLLAAIILAVDLFTAPANISQASIAYRGWIKDWIDAMAPMLAPPLRQIEGPKANVEV